MLIAWRLTAQAGYLSTEIRVLVGGLVYSLHPALIEPVAWISGRFDLLATFFVLLALYGYLSWQGWRRDLWVAFFFLLGLLSKEMAASLPVLLTLFYLGRQGPGMQWRSLRSQVLGDSEWRIYVLLVATVVLVVVLRLKFASLVSEDRTVEAALGNTWHRLAFIGQTILFYAKMTFWPIADINPQHPFRVDEMGIVSYLVGTAALAGAIAIFCIAIMRRSWPLLLLAAWEIALLPVLNIVPLIAGGNIGHDRFLTLPLAFFALSIVTMRFPAVSPRMHKYLPLAASTLGIILAGVFILNIRVTLPLWQNELSLWSWAYARYPEFPTVQNNYISASVRFGKLSQAKAAIAKVDDWQANTKVNVPTRQLAVRNLIKGEYYTRTNELGKALNAFQDTLALSPTPPHEYLRSNGVNLQDIKSIHTDDSQFFYRAIYWDLAVVHVRLRHFEQALEDAQITLLYAPHYAPGWFFKGLALYGLDRWANGNEAVAQARHYYTLEGNQDANRILREFLSQLCTYNETPAHTCAEWKKEVVQQTAVSKD
jgi:hypothetical protein